MTLGAVFHEWDADGSRSISAEELQAGLSRLGLFEQLTYGQFDMLLAMMNPNGDGEVTFGEFMSFMGRDLVDYVEAKLHGLVRSAEEAGASIEQLFPHFDKNGDGKITTAEFEEALRQLSGFDYVESTDVRKLVQRFSSDGDDNVSLQEFMRFLGKDFKAATYREAAQALRKVEKDGWEGCAASSTSATRTATAS